MVVKPNTQKATFVAFLCVVVCAVTGCVPQFFRFRYLSFEAIPGIEIRSVAAIELDNLVSGPTVPAEYLLSREEYQLHILINPKRARPNATIALKDADGSRLLPQPTRGTRTDRARSCGSYEPEQTLGTRFEFFWIICGDDADPEEFVIVFDVIAKDGSVREEMLPFTLKKDGFFWVYDKL